MNATKEKAMIYVGTYAKYNSGSIFGKWLDLENYSDKNEFLEACAELHKDEADPEFMFQDYEGIPENYISESWINEEVWTEWLTLDDREREIFEAYRTNFDGDYDDCQDRFQGEYNSEEDFAYSILEETGELNAIPENLRYYFDYEKYARDLFLDGYVFIDGYVFYTY